MDYQDINRAVATAFTVGLPLMPPQSRSVTLLYPGPGALPVYDPVAGFTPAQALLEQTLTGFVTNQTTLESLEGVAVRLDQTVFTTEHATLPPWIVTALATQDFINQLTQGSSQYRIRLNNGTHMKIYTVKLTGPTVAFVLRKAG